MVPPVPSGRNPAAFTEDSRPSADRPDAAPKRFPSNSKGSSRPGVFALTFEVQPRPLTLHFSRKWTTHVRLPK